MSFGGWEEVADRLRQRSADDHLNEGQHRSLAAISERFLGGASNLCRGVVVADEVGMGKTRVACAVADAVVRSGGRVAIAVPGGLGYQWSRELAGDGRPGIELLRSLWGFLQAYANGDEWHRHPVVLVSHHLPNWHIRRNSQCGRWRLVSALVAEFRKAQGRSYPHGYGAMKHDWVAQAARGILKAVGSRRAPLRVLERLNQQRWRDLDDPSRYRRDTDLGRTLARSVGWGLGRFDLVVIDEAHKGKGDESMVSRLLEEILHTRKQVARLALTATPVALHIGEWSRTLGRVGVDQESLGAIEQVAQSYAKATAELRSTWRTDLARREAWEVEARRFEAALKPYVLRRDKREDLAVRRYAEYAGDTESYRRVEDLVLRTHELSPDWRRVVVASEALSTTVRGSEDTMGKRLRLTLANGHGISWLIGAAQDRARPPQAGDDLRSKRLARARCWEDVVLAGVAESRDLALLEHPQICRAADFLDDRVAAGQKVLVFGRFSRPIRALTDLLNARARVRAMVTNLVWPQEKPWDPDQPGRQPLPEDLIAASQLGFSARRLATGFERHAKRYQADQNQRAWLYRNLVDLLGSGLQRLNESPPWAGALIEGIDDRDRAVLGRAVWELLPPRARRRAKGQRDGGKLERDLARTFIGLAVAALDDDPFEPDDDARRDASWQTLLRYLKDEFSPQRSRMARVLDGATAPPTRRLLQAAFNRPQSEPRVLVAQSMVGREGLNLHEACRVVLLLHPEWNPGVVEQQIGRVDRYGSRWQTELEEQDWSAAANEDLPRIEVHALVFEGTYDEYNWTVLKRRWADLRAQLHGVVVPLDETGSVEERRVAEELNAAAPDFSP